MKSQSPKARHKTRRKRTTTLLFVLLLLSFWLRVYRLGDKSVWWDEGWTVWLARQSLAQIARRTASDVHPPLYYWMLHFWRLGTGDSEFGLRLLSCAFGVLTVAASYRLGREVSGPKAGLLAALLLSISRFNICWSQEIRMYALAALLAALSLLAAIRFWDRDSLKEAALYCLFTTAGLYTLYLSVSVMVVVNLIWLLVLLRTESRGRALLRWGALHLVVVALFAPWLAFALGYIPTWSSASPVALDVFLRIYFTVLATGIPVSVESYWWLTVPVLVIFVVGLAALLRRVRRDFELSRNVALLIGSLLFSAGGVYLLCLPREIFFYSPQFAPRYLLISAPAFYVLLAWGLARLGEGRLWPLGAILTSVVVSAACYGLLQYYPGRILLDDYKALKMTLRAYQRPGDAVVLYTDKDWPVFAYHYSGRWWGVPHAQPMTPEVAAAYLQPLWEEHQGVWLVTTPYASVNDPQREIPAWLWARASCVVEHRFADKVLLFFARTEERAGKIDELAPGFRPPEPLEADWELDLRLVGYEQPVREYQSGDTIHLFLYWEVGEDAHGKVPGFSICLEDRQGRAWKRKEFFLKELGSEISLFRQQVDLVVPPDAPSGRYAFAVRPTSGGEAFRFGCVSLRELKSMPLTTRDVAITHPLEIDFGDGVRLLGYDLEAEGLQPGGTITLTLYWQAQKPLARRYKVFTHLLGEFFNAGSGNFLWGQKDSEPVNGMRPTSTWRTGEVIVDSYVIPLLDHAPTGRYTVEIGLYDPATGGRLPVLDEEGHFVADHLVLTHLFVGEEPR
jgi:4-amino-4-deoxy-L-arabinose transferase-like glycosyltransferase